MTRKFATLLMGLLLAISLPQSADAQTNILVGSWEGEIQVMGTELPTAVAFADGDDGLEASMDVQGASGVPLDNVTLDGDVVHFELQGGAGVAVFDGKIEADQIAGSFTQAGVEGSFELRRLGDEEESEPIDE